ncbi:hypothetical protein ACFQGX_21580 [Nonomuraea dietziae]|uniref:hypothetical protein n=1 Tax=Nonomuraea dietziae TaxID=65515 RepID=UPI0036102398
MPVRIPARRTPGDILAGLGALVVLVALVGGVPFALLTLAGPPISPELLDIDILTSNVGTSTVVAIMVLLVWLAWLQLFVCVIVEVYGGIRRVGMPARVPLSGATQALANRLVSAVLLLFTAGGGRADRRVVRAARASPDDRRGPCGAGRRGGGDGLQGEEGLHRAASAWQASREPVGDRGEVPG